MFESVKKNQQSLSCAMSFKCKSHTGRWIQKWIFVGFVVRELSLVSPESLFIPFKPTIEDLRWMFGMTNTSDSIDSIDGWAFLGGCLAEQRLSWQHILAVVPHRGRSYVSPGHLLLLCQSWLSLRSARMLLLVATSLRRRLFHPPSSGPELPSHIMTSPRSTSERPLILAWHNQIVSNANNPDRFVVPAAVLLPLWLYRGQKEPRLVLFLFCFLKSLSCWQFAVCFADKEEVQLVLLQAWSRKSNMPSSFNAASSSWKLKWGGCWFPSFPLSIFYYCQSMMCPHLGFNLPVKCAGRRGGIGEYSPFSAADSWGNLSTPSTAHLHTCTSSCLHTHRMMTAAAVSAAMCSHPRCSSSLVAVVQASHAWRAALLGATLVGPPLISINNRRFQLLLSAPDRELDRCEGTVPS